MPCGAVAFTATTCTPSAGAFDSTCFNTRGLAELPGFNNTATRDRLGERDFNNSSCFALISTSMTEKPVILPPGCAKLATIPAPTNAPPVVDLKISAENPSQLLQTLSDCRNAGLHVRIIGLSLFQPANASHPIWLLRVSTARPSRSSATDQANKFASSHCPSQTQKAAS